MRKFFPGLLSADFSIMEKHTTIVNKDNSKCNMYSGANFIEHFKMHQYNSLRGRSLMTLQSHIGEM